MPSTEENVVELDLGVSPHPVLGPMLIQDDFSTFLIFPAKRKTSHGTIEDAGTAIIELLLCSQTKFGYPNDEALGGHRLGKWLRWYSIYEVFNSAWDSEIAAQN